MPHQPPPSRRPDEVGGHAQRHRVPGGLWERRSLPGDAVELWIVSCCVMRHGIDAPMVEKLQEPKLSKGLRFWAAFSSFKSIAEVLQY